MCAVSSNCLEQRQPLLNTLENGAYTSYSGVDSLDSNERGLAKNKPTNKRKPSIFERHKRKKAVEKEQEALLKIYEADEMQMGSSAETQEQLDQNNQTKETRRLRVDKWLATIVFLWNVLMLFGNLLAAWLSGSYAVISAFIDSSMDIVSSVIVWVTIWAINNTNEFNYPRGRQRLEIVSVLSCSIFMGVTNLMMIIQSITAIVTDSVDPKATLPTVLILVCGISGKVILMIICYKHGSINTKILALDQRNDIITNIVALLGAYIGDNYWLYADPGGAILVCSFIAYSWFSNAFENIPLIVGRRVEQIELSRIIRIAINHDPRIKYLDHLMVYQCGSKALVELHVVLDEHLPLRVTHDLTEALERKLKALEFVERVFVHVDYCCDGKLDGN